MIFAFRGRNVLVCTKDIDGDGVRDITVPIVTGFDGGTPGAGRRSADITVPSVAGFDGQKDMFLQYLFEKYRVSRMKSFRCSEEAGRGRCRLRARPPISFSAGTGTTATADGAVTG